MNYTKGMFIRTLDGHIAQITSVDESFYYQGEKERITKLSIDKPYTRDYGYSAYDYVYSNWLRGASDNLVDLARQGDFINGERIEDILDEFVITKVGAYHKETLSNDKIESFMSKEDFERVSYQNARTKQYVRH